MAITSVGSRKNKVVPLTKILYNGLLFLPNENVTKMGNCL
uniref:Uncharacterized protein n=1 Tax=Rhizophora mucronata TaxID=61149 RepID=A0A2P2PV96_RHIMU